MHRPATLCELLRAWALRTRAKVFAFATTRTLRLASALWPARIVAISFTWRICRTALSIALTIRLWTAKRFTARTIVTPLIFCTRWIYRTAIAIALRLFTTRAISLALAFHLRTALWFTRVFRAGQIVFATLAFARLIATRLFTLWCCIVTLTSFGGRRCVRLRCFSGRFVRRSGFLGLQRRDAEGNSAAKPCE